MINWVRTERSKVTSDVSISLINKKETLSIIFTQGALSTKLHHAEKVMIGFDEATTRLYFCADPKGYSCKVQKSGNARVSIPVARIIDYIHPSALAGEYEMRDEPQTKYPFISIGALSR